MNNIKRITRPLSWATSAMLAVLLTACGSGGEGRDPILGTGANSVMPPTVTAVAPVNNATGVPINLHVITADFSERIAPLAGGASIVVSCAAPCVNPIGTASLDASGRTVTVTLASGAN